MGNGEGKVIWVQEQRGEVWEGVLRMVRITCTIMSSCNSFQDRSTSMCREKVSRHSCLQLTPAQGVYLMFVSCHYLQCMSVNIPYRRKFSVSDDVFTIPH